MQLNSKPIENLMEAIVSLRDINEAKKFLRDLLTEREILEFANRWQVAQMLNKRVPYSEIEAKTGMSSTTIARISKWLKRGMGGYRLMLKKIGHHRQHSLKKGLS